MAPAISDLISEDFRLFRDGPPVKYQFIVVPQKRGTLMRLISSSTRKPKVKRFFPFDFYLRTCRCFFASFTSFQFGLPSPFASSAIQSSAPTLIRNAIVFIDTSIPLSTTGPICSTRFPSDCQIFFSQSQGIFTTSLKVLQSVSGCSAVPPHSRLTGIFHSIGIIPVLTWTASSWIAPSVQLGEFLYC